MSLDVQLFRGQKAPYRTVNKKVKKEERKEHLPIASTQNEGMRVFLCFVPIGTCPMSEA
jgi:hypothetical protein